MNKKQEIGRLILLIVLSLNIITVPVLMGKLFPNNGGFTRNVIFVHPTNSSDGYYILVDEIHTSKPITFLFHSRGSLETGLSSVSWTQDDMQMNCSYFGASVQISSHQNYLYADIRKEEHEYVRVQPSIGTKYLITLIHFKNTTLGNIIEINSTVNEQVLAISINSTDQFVLNLDPEAKKSKNWNYTNFQTNANFFLTRESSLPENNFIVTAPTTILIKESNPLYNGKLNPVIIVNETSYTDYNKGFSSVIEYSTPLDFSTFSSPGLYFTEDELPELRNKINMTGSQWETWYDHLEDGSVISLAFRGRIEENQVLISQCEDELLNLGSYYEDELKDIQDIDQSATLTNYILAFDMIQNNISTQSQNSIREILRNTVEPLYIHHVKNVVYRNNHLIVSSVAVGLAGILLNIPEWVEETQRSMDYYLNGDGIRPNGACYEGAHYAYFEFRHASKFFYALQRAGGYNYFTNPRFQAFLNYSVQSMAPTGEAPVFEDCQVNRTLNIIASLAMSNVYDSNPILGENLKFLYARTPVYPYEYVTQIVMNHKYSINASHPEIVGQNQGFIYPSDGYACFRSGWDPNDFYFILSNKNFIQSHVHEDENSFELYAFGKKWITNPGYPSWGWEGHSYTISTEASNSAIINGRGQFSHLGDGFSSAVQHELVDYVESPTKITYLHPGNLWNWTGALLLYVLFLILLIGIVALEIIFPRMKGFSIRDQDLIESISLHLKQKTMSNRLSYLHGINHSLAIWLITIPLLTRTYDFMDVLIPISHLAMSIIFYSSLSMILVIPFISYSLYYRKRTTLFAFHMQEFFFQMLVNIGIGVIIAPILISAYDKMIFESGSTLIIVDRLTLSISLIMPSVIGIVVVILFNRILSFYLNKTQLNLDLVKKLTHSLAWFWLIVFYLLLIALRLIHR